MDKEPTWGEGYRTGMSTGIYNAIHRITALEAEFGSDLTLQTIKDYLRKDSEWELRDVPGFSDLAFMEEANGWSAGWWNTDNY